MRKGISCWGVQEFCMGLSTFMLLSPPHLQTPHTHALSLLQGRAAGWLGQPEALVCTARAARPSPFCRACVQGKHPSPT
jgi:hypothetical protein